MPTPKPAAAVAAAATLWYSPRYQSTSSSLRFSTWDYRRASRPSSAAPTCAARRRRRSRGAKCVASCASRRCSPRTAAPRSSLASSSHPPHCHQCPLLSSPRWQHRSELMTRQEVAAAAVRTAVARHHFAGSPALSHAPWSAAGCCCYVASTRPSPRCLNRSTPSLKSTCHATLRAGGGPCSQTGDQSWCGRGFTSFVPRESRSIASRRRLRRDSSRCRGAPRTDDHARSPVPEAFAHWWKRTRASLPGPPRRAPSVAKGEEWDAGETATRQQLLARPFSQPLSPRCASCLWERKRRVLSQPTRLARRHLCCERWRAGGALLRHRRRTDATRPLLQRPPELAKPRALSPTLCACPRS